MSLSKLTKYLNKPDDPLTGHRTLTPVLFTDSKGDYLKRYIRPGITSQIRFWTQKGRTTENGLDWLRNNWEQKVGHLDNIAIYVWLGTCDLTTYNRKTRHIELITNIDEGITKCLQNLQQIADIIKPYPACKIIFLEIPPFSIYTWNCRQNHPNPNQFKNKDCILATGIETINQGIAELNLKLQVKAPPLVQDISHNQLKNTKNRHHRKSDKYNFQLFTDGIHPSPTLAKVWIKKIGKLAQDNCYQ